MSAWLCESKLLSCVVDVVKGDTFKKYDPNNIYRSKSESELLQMLSDINTENLNYLYVSFPSDVESDILGNLNYVELDVSDVQRHKSVCSFIYQSCDMFDKGDNELFDLLSEWREDYRPVYEGCDWDNCEWDIDNPLN